jgi:hypothetical protein
MKTVKNKGGAINTPPYHLYRLLFHLERGTGIYFFYKCFNIIVTISSGSIELIHAGSP